MWRGGRRENGDGQQTDCLAPTPPSGHGGGRGDGLRVLSGKLRESCLAGSDVSIAVSATAGPWPPVPPFARDTKPSIILKP